MAGRSWEATLKSGAGGNSSSYL